MTMSGSDDDVELSGPPLPRAQDVMGNRREIEGTDNPNGFDCMFDCLKYFKPELTVTALRETAASGIEDPSVIGVSSSYHEPHASGFY